MASRLTTISILRGTQTQCACTVTHTTYTLSVSSYFEVGLWDKLKSYDYEDSYSKSSWHSENTHHDEEDHYERRRWICREYLDRLRWACRDTYAYVVLSCIMIDSSDDEVGAASERELCARIVADLEGCRA